MIWNAAQNVIYNGSSVQSVIYNGSVIWPSAPSAYPWSASGVMYSYSRGEFRNPVIKRFTWLTDVHPDEAPIVSGSPYCSRTASAAYGSYQSGLDTAASSLSAGSKHKDLSIYISATASATGGNNAMLRVVVNQTNSTSYWSPASATAISGSLITTGQTYNLTSFNYWSTGSVVTATALLSAASGIIAEPNPNTDNGAGADVMFGNGTAGMQFRWSASGVYLP